MSRRFVATIVAGALTLTSFSAGSAQAGNNDLARFLVGVAALVAIGAAIDHNRSASQKDPVVTRHHPPRIIEPPKQTKKSVAPKPRVHAVLPEYCLRQVRSHKGPRLIYGQRCLRNNYQAFQSLPDRCHAVVHGPNGTRQGYRPDCLYRAGFQG